MEDIAAILVNYNCAELTIQTAAAVRIMRPNAIIVVVDANSNILDWKDLEARIPADIKRVRIERPIGYCASINVGLKVLKASSTPYVIVLNSDLMFPDMSLIDKMCAALSADARALAVSPLIATRGENAPAEEQIQVRRLPTPWMLAVGSSWWLKRLPLVRQCHDFYTYGDHRPYDRGAAVVCDTINGACFMVKRELLALITGFDEGTYLYGEELVLGAQIRRLGSYCLLATNTSVEHLQGVSTGAHGQQIRFAMFRTLVQSELYYLRRYSDAHCFWPPLLLAIRALDYCSKALYNAVLSAFHTVRTCRLLRSTA